MKKKAEKKNTATDEEIRILPSIYRREKKEIPYAKTFWNSEKYKHKIFETKKTFYNEKKIKSALLITTPIDIL